MEQNKVQIIAEIGNSHEGSLGLAKQFIKAAADCGVDAVKFQTHIFEAESLPNAPNPPYFKDESRKEYFTRTAFDKKQLRKLKSYAEDECNVEFMSSPFSIEAVQLLDQIGVRCFKIPSGEVATLPLLEEVARTKKRVLLSSGMSTWKELELAIQTLRNNGCSDLVILQCTSKYPCPPDHAGLNVLRELEKRFSLPVGYSDHTIGLSVPLAAVTMGARVIEKHFILSRKMYGSDAANSTEPDEFRRLVSEIRFLEKTLSSPVDKDFEAATLREMKRTFEKSIVASRALKKDALLIAQDLTFKKPGNGIRADRLAEVLGKRLVRSVQMDEMILPEFLQ